MPRFGFSPQLRFATIAALLAMSTSLSGCVVAVVGGGAVAGYSVIGQDLSPSQQIRDAAIKAEVQNSWGQFNNDLAHRLDATVYDGGVLITGQVPDEGWRGEAVKRAWRAQAVKQVYDNIAVAPETHFMDSARDTVITTRLRSDLVFDRAIRSVNYIIKTEDGVVYLLGTARGKGELDRVTNHARNIPNVRRVISYVRVWEDRPQDLPANGAQSASPPAAEPPDEQDDREPPPPPQNQPSNYPPPPNAPASSPPPPSSGTIQTEPLN